MVTRVDLGGGRYVTAEFSADTGIADITDITDAEVRGRVHSLAGSFEEISGQLRVATDYAHGQGWISDSKAKHNRTLIAQTLRRQKARLRQQR